MKLNKKITYGLRTMIELAMNWEKEGIYQKEIARKQDISFKFLDHIISHLKSAGLVVNAEGRKSGYKLVKNPELISVYDIYRAFESEMAIVDCITVEGICNRRTSCAAKDVWEGLNNKIIKHMDSFSLKSLSDKQKILNAENIADVYYI